MDTTAERGSLKHGVRNFLINSCRLPFSIINWLPFQFLGVFLLTYQNEDKLSSFFLEFRGQGWWIIAFEALFLFKYIKVVAHLISFLLYRPYAIPEHPTISAEDVTVIIPTVGTIDEPEFRETLRTILANKPHEIIVCTVGREKLEIAQRVCNEEVRNLAPADRSITGVTVSAIEQASKRKQIYSQLIGVDTKIVALADDHVFWGLNYLKSSLAAFEDPRIGGVGTNKRVRRDPFQFTWANFLNFIACNYLERHNFECTASTNIDQGVFVLSGRTVFYRTAVLKHPSFAVDYLRETWFFGTVGREGFAVDDDNLLTRFTIGAGQHKVWFQNSEESTMHTTLGEPGKFFKQMDRWIRTTWRSNSTSLLSDQTPWRTQPWSVYAIYLSSFVNFALFYDAALLITLWKGWEDMDLALFRLRGSFMDREKGISILAWILFLSKMIKPFPHFWRNPRDILWIPGYILFGYYHSFIKLKALLTVHVVAWGTRPGVR
ncbi:hypothetical protein LZ554_009453 [Drepanopeziza brunnea f. sp. 'monogermtubi']|nr:hypothetical protein LZ554_009453 [Drepanopeziza brunnea f. sp. 'monogermtubi']